MKYPVVVSLFAGVLASLSACYSSNGQDIARASSAPPEALNTTPKGDPKVRMIEVGDGESLGFSFDVFLDGAQIGTTVSGGRGEWGRPLAAGAHLLEIAAKPGAAAARTQVDIKIYSGTTRPISFPEPQAASSRCEFNYALADDQPLVGLGKQFAFCRIHVGERLSLTILMPESQ